MNRTEAMRLSYVAACMSVDHVPDDKWMLRYTSDWIYLGTQPIEMKAEAQAQRLFDHALKYKYGPAVLYSQQREWLKLPKLKMDASAVVPFTVFHAVANALAPLIDRDMPAPSPERERSNRVQGFARGFDDDDYGRRTLKVGDDRESDGRPMLSPDPASADAARLDPGAPPPTENANETADAPHTDDDPHNPDSPAESAPSGPAEAAAPDPLQAASGAAADPLDHPLRQKEAGEAGALDREAVRAAAADRAPAKTSRQTKFKDE